MARWFTIPFALVVALLPLGCLALQDAILTHIQRNQGRLQSYQGVLVEKGLIPEGELTSDIAFRRPGELVSRVTSPELYKGTTLLASGDSLLLYWPQVGYVIRVDHLPHLDSADYKQLVTDAYWYGVGAYDGDLGDSSHVAGHATNAVSYVAKATDNPNRKSSYQVYDKFSLPLSGEIHFAGKVDYGFRYDSIAFNQPLDDSLFSMAVPPSTIVTHWDLDGPNLTVEQAKEQANFPLVVPAALPEGYALQRLVRVDGPVPAFTFVYRKGIHYLLFTEYKDLGIRLAAAELGVPLPAGSHQGKLLPGPLSSSYIYRASGVTFQVFGNVPFEEILKTAGRL